MEPGKRILIAGSAILLVIFLFFSYISDIIPKYEIVITEKDFELLDIEYTNVIPYDNQTAGEVKLTFRTNKDSLIVVASTKTDSLSSNGRFFCGNEFEKAGLHTLEGCRGDPSYGFWIGPVNIDHNFKVCAKAPYSSFYKSPEYCKSITLQPSEIK